MVRPVTSTLPSGSTTAPRDGFASASAGGGATGWPLASSHTPGAQYDEPSLANTATQGVYFAPAGASTQRPTSQYQRPCIHTHSPSIHAVAPSGRGGTSSTRPGGGPTSTRLSALVACRAYGG